MKKEPCQHEKTDCINSRMNHGYRYRRYKCRKCGHRWSTAEVKVSNTRIGMEDGVLGGLKQEITNLSPAQTRALKALIEAFTKPEQ